MQNAADLNLKKVMELVNQSKQLSNDFISSSSPSKINRPKSIVWGPKSRK